tara:strand:+ start:1592 stop:1747 length:156 start_codon:yes stop_codon:yes gene_type:complete
MTTPTPENHFLVSMIKSAIRIIGCIAMVQSIIVGAGLLAIAEVLGIIEEIV